MKTKTMKRSEWWRLEECKFTSCSLDQMTEAGLIQMKKLAKPLFIHYNAENPNKCIADNGYSWLQIAKKDAHIWTTAMFNEHDELLECYFDITNQNFILPNGDSSFEDLYLDVVFFPNGQIDLLDEDELEEALQNNIISKQQFDLAYTIANQHIAWLENIENQQALIQFCNKVYCDLKR